MPFELNDTGMSIAFVGVGAAPVVDEEFDNTVYTGTYTFTTIPAAQNITTLSIVTFDLSSV